MDTEFTGQPEECVNLEKFEEAYEQMADSIRQLKALGFAAVFAICGDPPPDCHDPIAFGANCSVTMAIGLTARLYDHVSGHSRDILCDYKEVLR